MADTFWASGLWAADFWATDLWSGTEPVVVPDVVGQTQADGTLTLEGAGFVVVVVTAASSAVPAGSIISQAPAGGTEAAPGSTVTITVSTGEDDLLDARLAARRPNVRMRGLRKEPEAAPLPPEITNMPGAPKVLTGALAQALDGGIDAPPKLSPAPKPKVDVAQPGERVREATPPTEVAGSIPAVDTTPAAPAGLTREDLLEALRSVVLTKDDLAAILKAAVPVAPTKEVEQLPIKMMEGLNTVLGVQVEKMLSIFGDLVTQIAGARAELASERKARELGAKNRRIAEQLAKQLFEE